MEISAVIVTWNKQNDVINLLKNLQSINIPPAYSFSITVVDNNSNDNTVSIIKQQFPNINLIEKSENTGGAGGFNAGMRWVLENKIDSKYIWLLDNDILVDKNALVELVHVLDATPEAGLCGSRIMERENPTKLIEIGAFINYKTGTTIQNTPLENIYSTKKTFDIDYAAACSLLARTDIVKTIGLWHEELFIYWDDMEWGARFKKFGYRVLGSSQSIVYHPSWGTRNLDNSAIWRYYYRSRNSLWFFSNYSFGIKRYLLLSKIIKNTCITSILLSVRGLNILSDSLLNGIDDFFNFQYGKKIFNTQQYVPNTRINKLYIFLNINENQYIDNVLKIIEKLSPNNCITISDNKYIEKYDNITLHVSNNVIKNSSKFYIILSNIFKRKTILTSTLTPIYLTFPYNKIIRTNYETGELYNEQKPNYTAIFLIVIKYFRYIIKLLHYNEKASAINK